MQVFPILRLFEHNMKERVPTTVCDYYNGHTYFFVNMVLFPFFLVFNEIFSLGKQVVINPQPLMDMVYIFICFFNLCGRHVTMKVVIVYQNTDEVDYAMPSENLWIFKVYSLKCEWVFNFPPFPCWELGLLVEPFFSGTWSSISFPKVSITNGLKVIFVFVLFELTPTSN